MYCENRNRHHCLKATAGNVYGVAIVLAGLTGASFINFYNSATSTVSGTALMTIPIAGAGTVIIPPTVFPLLYCSTGIAISVTSSTASGGTQTSWSGSVWWM
jgi:hypothetical protein